MSIWTPWAVQLVMVQFEHGPIWASTKNVQKKISPSGHAQIRPVRPIDIPTYWNLVVLSCLVNLGEIESIDLTTPGLALVLMLLPLRLSPENLKI